ncbi:MAG: hypothetical protein SGPRY_003317 [Prymnesium sp.]
MEESASRAQASWGANNALHGLLRKLGAGLDDLLPSVSDSHNRLNNILTGMKADDDGRQLAALSELCELLSIGTEESISALSVDIFVPLLVQQLRKEHNADIMLLASRAMCHMMDALPSSPAAIVHYDAVPLFCARLLSIEYIDLAEQALQALEKLSHEHPLAILRAGGMLAVLQYVDFFATGVQRISVSTAANLCRGLPVECGHLVVDAIPLLTNLLQHQDQKVLEKVCLAFARLVEAFAHAPQKLDMIASHGLLPNLLQLISTMVAGSALSDISLSDPTYTMLLRTMAMLCRGSAAQCKQLLELQVASKLREILLTDESLSSGIGASVIRPNDQLHQILSLADELLPPLPWVGITPLPGSRSQVPKRRLKRAGDDEEDATSQPSVDREEALLEHPQLLEDYASKLFSTLLHVYNCAANAAVRSKCLSCITKVLYLYPAASLAALLRELPFASFVASLLSSQEVPTAMSALYMADILLTKLPNIYSDKFLREGVFHAVHALCCKVDTEPAAVKAPSGSKRLSRASSETEQASASSFAAPSSARDAGRKASNLRQSSSLSSASAGLAAAGPPSRVPYRSSAQENSAALAARAALFRDTFIASDAKLASALEHGEGSITLQKLRSLADTMCNDTIYSTLNPKVPLTGQLLAFSDVEALRQFSILVAEREGISTFELANSGLVDAVLRYLTSAEDVEAETDRGEGALTSSRRRFRLLVFCHFFLGLPQPQLPPSSTPAVGKNTRSSTCAVPNPIVATTSLSSAPERSIPVLQSFVEKLQDAVNMTERFPLVLSDSNSPDGSSGLRALTQPFKLRLQRGAGQSASLKEYANNVVLIEPLATAAAIEDFLWPKVRRDSSLRQALRDVSATAAAPGVAEAAASAVDYCLGTDGAVATRSAGAGKQPVRGDGSAAMAPGSSAPALKPAHGKGRQQSELGVFLGSFEDSVVDGTVGGEGEEVDDDDDDDDCGEDDDDEDEDGGSMLGSPALASSLDAECVHDLQLSSPERQMGSSTNKSSPPAFTLPPRDTCAAPAPAACPSRGAEGGSSAAGSSSSNGAATTAAAATATSAAAAVPAAAASVPAAEDQGIRFPDESANATSTDADGRSHHLMLVLNGHVLPFGMTIFQAIRQYGSTPGVDGESGIGPRLWGDVHTITYQLISLADLPRLSENESLPTDTSAASSGHQAAAIQVASRQTSVMAFDANPIATCLASKLPVALREMASSGPLLHLLWILEVLSTNWRSLYDEGELPHISGTIAGNTTALPPSVFLNRKLNAKLTRQLQDPLALCSRSLPAWCASLTASCAFFFSFESRRLYLHSTAFGLSRALQRLQQHTMDGGGTNTNSSERSEFRLGRLPRQKVRISRGRVMDSALKVMDLYASHKAMLEVEYFGEVGTGLGPTLEFYTLVSRELRRRELHLWVGDDTPESRNADKQLSNEKGGDDGQQYVYTPFGLFPKAIQQDADGTGVPARVTQLFTFMGRFIAKAMLDNRLVDLPLSVPFLRSILGLHLGISDLAEINPQLAKTLTRLQALVRRRQSLIRAGEKPSDLQSAVSALTLDGCAIIDLSLDFTLPGQPEVELTPQGADRAVTIDNLGEYVQRVLEVFLLEGVRAQIAAFKKVLMPFALPSGCVCAHKSKRAISGFSDVFPIEHLRAFAAEELDVLFNGTREKWERDVIIEHLKLDHGYTRSSRAVGFLLEILCELDDATLSQFLKFITGSPRLPVGGLARLSPRLTIVLKRPENGVSPDAYLPSVMTCANYLKLPDYSSKTIMRDRLMTSIFEGQGAFLLS